MKIKLAKRQALLAVFSLLFIAGFAISLISPSFLDLSKSGLRAQPANPPLPVLIQSRTQNIPTIAQHIADAQMAGQPMILSRIGIPQPARRQAQHQNRKAACRGFVPPPPPNTSCDEYPFASSYEGGAGSSTRGVPIAEQRRQGREIGTFYVTKAIPDRGRFMVLAVP